MQHKKQWNTTNYDYHYKLYEMPYDSPTKRQQQITK